MSKRMVWRTTSALALFTLTTLSMLSAQSQTTPHAPDGWDRPVASSTKAQPGPAPRHDISGTWEPANGPSDGIQGTGSKAMPADGKHEPPYTALGLELMNHSKPGNGNREVLPAWSSR